MPGYNGSGAFERNYDFSEEAAAGTRPNIVASDVDDELDEVATALSNVLVRDGQAAMTGPLNMGSQKITALATPTNTTDGATKAYVDTKAASEASAAQTAAQSYAQSYSGRVRQRVKGTLTSNFQTTSTSYVSTGLTLDITPTNLNNEIQVRIIPGERFAIDYTGGTTSDNIAYQARLVADGTTTHDDVFVDRIFGETADNIGASKVLEFTPFVPSDFSLTGTITLVLWIKVNKIAGTGAANIGLLNGATVAQKTAMIAEEINA